MFTPSRFSIVSSVGLTLLFKAITTIPISHTHDRVNTSIDQNIHTRNFYVYKGQRKPRQVTNQERQLGIIVSFVANKFYCSVLSIIYIYVERCRALFLFVNNCLSTWSIMVDHFRMSGWRSKFGTTKCRRIDISIFRNCEY